jgi:hypothetical protein
MTDINDADSAVILSGDELHDIVGGALYYFDTKQCIKMRSAEFSVF